MISLLGILLYVVGCCAASLASIEVDVPSDLASAT